MIIKSKEEIENIKKAVRLANLGQKTAKENIKIGMSEIELFKIIRESMELSTGCPIILEGDLVSGPRTEDAGGSPTERKFLKEDIIIVDLYPKLNEYWGDTTRTFFVGKLTVKQKEIYQIVLDTQKKSIDGIKPGVKACSIDKLAREYLDKKRLDKYFTHHTGHGIGLTHFEEPFIVPDNEKILEEGMVFTIEPGVYIPGFGGIRIEDDVVVTKNGVEVIYPYIKELE